MVAGIVGIWKLLRKRPAPSQRVFADFSYRGTSSGGDTGASWLLVSLSLEGKQFGVAPPKGNQFIMVAPLHNPTIF